MKNPNAEVSEFSLEINNETHYRRQAACYRKTIAYGKMLQMYPLLQDSIEEGKEERLIA